jgi:hypothetical protein
MSKGKFSHEFATRYEELVHREGADPLVVMFKLLKSRKHGIKFQAARELLQYRFPKLASAQVAVEQAGQMIMSWETPLEDKPSEEEFAQLTAIVGESVVVDEEP